YRGACRRRLCFGDVLYRERRCSGGGVQVVVRCNVVEKAMHSSSSAVGVTGYPHQLSTQTSLFSTRHPHALHVRDIDFVRLFHKCTYHGTGVDSRVSLASAPAFPKQVVAVPRPPFLVGSPAAPSSRPNRSRSSVS